MSMQDKFQHLYAVISGQRFLKNHGLGNEVPFFICPFKPEESVDMERLRHKLVNRLEQTGIRILQINLYDLSIEILKERNIWNQVLEIEASVSKDQLKELLQGVLDPETHLVPAIAAKLADEDFDVLFLAGVGEVFPYIRSHNVLNNLQSTAKEKPTVMFFPGAFTHTLESRASLDLFGKLHDDKYYRAFNIFHCEA
ncbi:BREX protein BrxB domain-containing protein [Desulfobacter vibrioformis]|uniref:BREX protein BrxB domain-containing protein n=1 Tax=Desulfobacter vibrioformis TaxID=34031 RepID=UPI00054D817E|nr:BREX protein BrxB domain-containing protein [Desulfobacter vibrioformis]